MGVVGEQSRVNAMHGLACIARVWLSKPKDLCKVLRELTEASPTSETYRTSGPYIYSGPHLASRGLSRGRAQVGPAHQLPSQGIFMPLPPGACARVTGGCC